MLKVDRNPKQKCNFKVCLSLIVKIWLFCSVLFLSVETLGKSLIFITWSKCVLRLFGEQRGLQYVLADLTAELPWPLLAFCPTKSSSL